MRAFFPQLRTGSIYFLLLTLCLALFATTSRAESPGQPHTDKIRLLMRGQALLKADQPRQAATAFSLALRIDPTDPRAQLALAEAFARQGQVARAEAYLRFLLRDPVQSAHEALYLKALALMQERYPVVGSGSFAILPSSNVEKTSSQDTFDTLLGRFRIENGGAETSGVGVELGLNGKYRRPLHSGVSLEFGAALRRIWYADAQLRFWRGRITADIVTLSAKDERRVGLHFDQSLYDDVPQKKSDHKALGAHVGWSRGIGGGQRLHLTGLIEQRTYVETDRLSGPYGTIGLGWSNRFDGGAVLHFGGSVERSVPALEYQRYWGGTLRAGYEQNLTRTLRGGLNADATLRNYDTNFAAVTFPRRDEVYRVGVSLSDSRIKIMGATPKLSCSYKMQDSRVSLYDMSSTDCRIGWSYQF